MRFINLRILSNLLIIGIISISTLINHSFAIITGQVMDNEKNLLSDVLIFWEEREITTESDQKGQFRIEEANTPGIYFFDFKKKGYESKVVTIELGDKDKSIFVVLNRIKTMRTFQARKKTLQLLTERQGVSSTVLNTDTLRKIKLNTRDDLSAMSANLFNIATGSSFNSGIGIRGVNSVNNLEPIVGLYIDGIAQFNSYIFPVLLGNVDNIEILKGPQSTLYGRNAMAGVIDITTKIPPNRFSIATSVDLANANEMTPGRQTYDLYFTAPLYEDRVFLKGGGFYHLFDGFFRNETLNRTVGGNENFSTYLRLDNFNEDFDFFFKTRYELLEESIFPYHANIASADKSPFTISHDRESISRKDIVDNYVRLAIPLDAMDIDINFTYQYYESSMGADLDFSSNKSSIFDMGMIHHLITSETRFYSSSRIEDVFAWSAGLYFYHQSRDVNSTLVSYSNNLNNKLVANDSITGGALLTSMTFALINDIYLILGGRLDVDHRKSEFNITYTNENIATLKSSKSFDDTLFVATPKIGIDYYPIPDILLYLNGTRGFRSGGYNYFTTSLDNVSYDAEYSWNIEYGVKSKFSIDNKIGNINLNGFYIYWSDQQINAYLPDENNVFEFAVVNAGTSENVGGEVEIDLPLFYGFKIGANYGFVVSKYTDLKLKNGQGEEVNYSGNHQTFVPQHTISSFLEHDFPFELLSMRDAVINRFDFKYISDHYFDVGNQFKQKGYYLLNYTFNLSLAGFVFTFWTKNILDQRYYSYGIPSNNDLRVQVGDPLSVGGKISFFF